MQGDNPTITACIITYNEAENLKRCLNSIHWVDDLIIVDSFSTDGTFDIAKKYTNKAYQQKFNDDFSKQRNFALKSVKSDWILFLDADETLPNYAEEVFRILIRDSKKDGYLFPRRNYIGKDNYFRYGYFYPDYQLRLFRKNKNIKYDNKIHERPMVVSNKTKIISNIEIYHNDSHSKYDSFLSFPRFIPFIKIEGKIIFRSPQSCIKILLQGLFEPLKHFYRSFIKETGYKDGYNGFRAAVLYSMYSGSIYIYALLLRIHHLFTYIEA